MTPTVTSTSNETLWEYARVRSFIFVLIPVLILFVVQSIFESSPWSHAIDDLIVAVVALVVLVVLFGARKAGSIERLSRANQFALAAGVLIALAGVLAVVVEYGDINDLSDDPLTIIGGGLAVITALVLLPGAGARSPGDEPRYRDEWLRIRTTFWFFPFFVAVGLGSANVFGGGAFFGGLTIFQYAEVGLLILAGLVGVVLLYRSQSISDPTQLRTHNNVVLALAIALLVIVILNGDILTLGFVIPLVVNRFV